MVATSSGAVELTDPTDIAAALQIYADQFCGLALQPCNWFHPDSTAEVIANCTAASAF